MNQSNQKRDQRFRKLLSLTTREANFIRNSGIRVPIEDYDVTRANFNLFLDGWSMKKKLSFVRKVLDSVGLSIDKVDEKVFRLMCHKEEALAVEALNYLAVNKDYNMEHVRSPEEENKKENIEQSVDMP